MANPVLIRELLTSLRTRRALALAVVFLFALAGLVMLMWPEGGVYSVAARSSQRLFITLSLALLTLVCLCAPAFTAVSITREKEQGTYDMLYHTMLRPGQIVMGKFVAGVGLLLVLIFSSLPMMGACFVLGGVSSGDASRAYLIVILAAVFLGMVGLLCSAFARSSFRALVLCYAFILCFCGLTWVPSIVLGLWAESVHSIHLVRALSPFAAMISVINPGRFQLEHPVPPLPYGRFADSMWVFCIAAVAGSIVSLLATYLRLRIPPQPRKHKDASIIEDRLELMKRHVKFPFYLLDPRKRKRMIGRLMNVIFVKEMRSKAFSRSVWVIRSMYLAMVASLVLAFLPLTQIDKIGIDTIVFTCVSLPLGLILLISPVLTASAITEEQEKGVFDMLRCTRLSAWTLVAGKLQVAWFFLLLLLVSTLPTFFVLTYLSCGPDDMEHLNQGINLIRPFNFQFAEGWEHLAKVDAQIVYEMLSAFAVVGVAMVLTTAIGVVVSAFSGHSSNATAASYCLMLTWAIGTFVPHLMSSNLPGGFVRTCLTLNPFVAAATAVSTDVFTTMPAGLWIMNLKVTVGAIAALLVVGWLRVWWLMRPQRD